MIASIVLISNKKKAVVKVIPIISDKVDADYVKNRFEELTGWKNKYYSGANITFMILNEGFKEEAKFNKQIARLKRIVVNAG
jgi:hypothetical protein